MKKLNNNLVPNNLNLQNRIKHFSKKMEEEFVSLMLKEMEKTIPNTQQRSMSHKYYKQLMTREIARISSDSSEGLGLQKLIYQNLMNKIYQDKNTTTNNHFKNSTKLKMYKK